MFKNKFVNHTLVVIYIILYVLCIIGLAILIPLFFNTAVDSTVSDNYLITLNPIQISLAKASTLIYMILIMPLMIWFFYVNKSILKGKMPQFVNHTLVVIYVIVYIMCGIGLGILTYKLFNTTEINTTVANGTTTTKKADDKSTTTSTVANGITTSALSLNTTELVIIQGSSVVYLSVIMPILIYCFYLLRSTWMPKW